jgi:hypothetical protein
VSDCHLFCLVIQFITGGGENIFVYQVRARVSKSLFLEQQKTVYMGVLTRHILVAIICLCIAMVVMRGLFPAAVCTFAPKFASDAAICPGIAGCLKDAASGAITWSIVGALFTALHWWLAHRENMLASTLKRIASGKVPL